MRDIFKKINLNKNSLVLIYIVFIAVFVVSSFFNFLSDKIKNQEEIYLTVNDFELIDLAVNDDLSLTSTWYDAQMIYKSKAEIKSIYYILENSSTGEICSYYLKNEGEDFSNHNRLFPEFSVKNEAFYIYPSDTTIIRLDIGSVLGETYEFKEIVLNKDIPFLKYFSLTNFELVLFIITPIFLNSSICFIKSLYNNYIKRKIN